MQLVLLVLLATAPHETNPVNIVLQTGITLYQKVFSSSQADACNFSPSCSRFAQRALRHYGFFWGTLMTSDRLMRCNPSAFGHFNTFYSGLHGYHVHDPVENNYIFAPVRKNDSMVQPLPTDPDTP